MIAKPIRNLARISLVVALVLVSLAPPTAGNQAATTIAAIAFDCDDGALSCVDRILDMVDEADEEAEERTAPSSCTVDVDENDTCEITCVVGQVLRASASASGGTEEIQVSCGGTSDQCLAGDNADATNCQTCESDGSDCPEVSSGGTGTCKMFKREFWDNDSGTGTCTAFSPHAVAAQQALVAVWQEFTI